jgi:osmotically inducible protein OsmC
MKGTNPEELLAAAHASCFTMKLSFVLEEAGYAPVSLRTTAHINFVNGAITGSKLEVYANIPGMSELVFRENVVEANRCCPVRRALSIAVTFGIILEP